MAKIKKNGPLTEEEKTFIRLNMTTMSPMDIGEQLGRNPETVTKFISTYSLDDGGSKGNILNLKKRQDWAVIKTQFSDEECELFEWHWNEIVKQFRDEIYHTEGMQIVNAIKNEVLANRALTEKKKIADRIDVSTKQLEAEQKKSDPDIQVIDNLNMLISTLTMAVDANSKEYRECHKKLDETLKGLKALREQRLNKVEDSKKSFPIWMSRLMNDKSVQRDFGIYYAKAKLAAECEKQRLGSVHLYSDGNYDRPLLNDETLKIESDINKLKKE